EAVPPLDTPQRSGRPGEAVPPLDTPDPAGRPGEAGPPLDTPDPAGRPGEAGPPLDTPDPAGRPGEAGPPLDTPQLKRPTVLGMLLGSGPRFARDAMGPVLLFYAGWKLSGLTAGILAATTLAVVIFVSERRRSRSGLGASIGLVVALTQATAGLATGSAVAYFAPGIIVNALYGLAFMVSVAVGRPLAGVFAQETYPFPPAVKASPTFRRIFSRVSLAWGTYLLLRSGLRLLVLSWRDVDLFVLVNIATGIPFTMALTAWSIWYGVRGFRRSAEWGWALRLGLVAMLLLGAVRPAHADQAAEIVADADRYRRPADSFVWKITITSQEAKKTPSVDGFEVFVKGGGRVFVKFVAPPRSVGRSLLALGRDLWIYLPDAGKPVRIPLSQRLVGQVANGDIARADYAGDYDATLVSDDEVDRVACHVLDLKAKSKDVTYSAIKYWVSKDGRRPLKAEFYAGTGTLLKTGVFDSFQTVAGHLLATRLTLTDAIRKDRRSVLDYGEVTIRELPDKYFDKNYMKTLD
ncbi:MAG TPA: outer membrane lipoprotein-sorting protein, partial [Acidimicrobiia bacterium]